MKRFNVYGMTCAACQARVEKAVGKLLGVTSVSVSLLTNAMSVEGDISDEEIIQAVKKAGYDACVQGQFIDDNSINKESDIATEQKDSQSKSVEDKMTKRIKKRLLSSLLLLVTLMYFSMGYTMFDFWLPSFFDKNYLAIGIVQLLISTCILVINKHFFISGFTSMLHASPNMDSLVSLGSGASYIYSVYNLFVMTKYYVDGNILETKSLLMDLYFESAAMILVLITIGKLLESKSKGKTTDALKSLMMLAPQQATVIIDGIEKSVPISSVKINDEFVVRPAQSIPVDGIILEGESAVNEASLTGESIPVDKNKGDNVYAATINQSGFLRCRATRVGKDTTLSQIIQLVSDATATKAPIAKIADKVSGIFVPTVIVIAIITFFIWMALGYDFSFALSRGISVLVISCPCALGLATPVAIMVGNGVGAKNGILFKNAISLEQTGKVKVVALDKTGTITKGEPTVTDIISYNGYDDNELLKIAYSLEIKSEHPLAKAIIKKAKEMEIEAYNSTEFNIISGNGIIAKIGNKNVVGGSLKFISSRVNIGMMEKVHTLADEGKTPMLFVVDDKLIGIIAVADTMKEDSVQAITTLKNMKIKTVMLTGDNQRTANAIGKKAGVDQVIAGVMPDEKENVIKQLEKEGCVAMVGDGINDAPALTSAHVGIAIGAGTDVAIDAADIVLMKSRLTDVCNAIILSKATLKNIHENLFWAFFYNIIGIPLAAGIWIPIFGLKLNPMFGAAAMSLSSFCVVTNALRINLVKLIGETRLDKSNTSNSDILETYNKEKKGMEHIMTKKMTIEGMMCGHCEANVKKTLEAIEGVTQAVVSHVDGTAIVTMTQEIDNDVLKNAVEAKDYVVKAID